MKHLCLMFFLCIFYTQSFCQKNYSEFVIDCELEMVYIQGGTFNYGDGEYDNITGERHLREVTVPSFYMAKYETTQKLWETVMGYNPSFFKGKDLPVENVSWNEVNNFITKLNQLTGKQYCLPTAEEWEYVAKEGVSEDWKLYSGSNNIDEVGWYVDNSEKKTHSVGQKKPNAFGIYDMTGNVWEYHSNYEGGFKGGSWHCSKENSEITYNGRTHPDNNNFDYIGFRLILYTEKCN
ncbi:MAG: formylglycine-generating enzyme family protein [Bacteroidales bacterium]|nr:formylglycine-generating enzyme family protein [Bacteroidales bacterium]